MSVPLRIDLKSLGDKTRWPVAYDLGGVTLSENIVQPSEFYTSSGWRKRGNDTVDAAINENLTPVASEYVSQIRKRLTAFVPMGNQVLDIGSGPIQYEEYLEISKGFSRRVCVDFSQEALDEATARLKLDGQSGIAVQGDYLNTDLGDFGPFDLIVCINVLYHFPRTQQKAVVEKALDELSPEGSLIIVYTNPNSLFNFMLRLGAKAKHKLHRHIKSGQSAPMILFEPHPLRWWQIFESDANVQMFAWRTLPPRLEQLFIRPWLGGRTLYRLLFRLEELPYWRLLASYITVVIRKL